MWRKEHDVDSTASGGSFDWAVQMEWITEKEGRSKTDGGSATLKDNKKSVRCSPGLFVPEKTGRQVMLLV